MTLGSRTGGSGLLSRVVATRRIDADRARAIASSSVEAPSLGDAIVGFARLAELALEESGLSRIQYRILQHLQQGHTIQSDLAFQLSVTKQSATRLVDTLADKRYITRKVDPADRRRVIHAITPKGQRALARADTVIERYLMLVLQDLEDDADIEAARKGIRLFGRASHASYGRVRPDGIVPGPRSSAMPSHARPKIKPL
jgi:DNA-binding MarR family transcriptional regulator